MTAKLEWTCTSALTSSAFNSKGPLISASFSWISLLRIGQTCFDNVGLFSTKLSFEQTDEISMSCTTFSSIALNKIDPIFLLVWSFENYSIQIFTLSLLLLLTMSYFSCNALNLRWGDGYSYGLVRALNLVTWLTF